MAIPLHNFTSRDTNSISFEIVELSRRDHYDNSIPHRHNYYEIFLFESGGGHHYIDFKYWEIEALSLHFVTPGQVHLLQRSRNCNGWVICFSKEFYYLNLHDKNLLFEMPFLNEVASHPVLNLQMQKYQRFAELLRQMNLEYVCGDEHSEDLLRSYLNIMLIESKRLFDVNPSNEGRQLFTSHNLYSRFCKLLERNYAQNHKVQEYAEMLGVTDKQLTASVRDASGKSALEHIHARIILEAKRLLLHSGLSNKEIAYHLHFDDPSHFGKFFKGKEGVTPNEYRQSLEQLM